MLTIMHEQNSPITREDISEFASRHEIVLPDAYVAFLLKNNGGRPEPGAFPIHGMPDNPFGIIEVFHGINSKNDTDDLGWILAEVCTYTPKGLVPIACTGTGDYVCIDLRRPNSPVVFWDTKPSWGNNIWNEKDLYPVAESFESFLEELFHWELPMDT